MAIAFSQASTALNSGGSSTTHTFSGNGLASVTAMTNGIAFVLYDCTGTGPTSPLTVTWGGKSMIKIGDLVQSTRGSTQSLWYILNPASGAVSIVDTFAAVNTPNMTWVTYSGVSQTAPEAFNTGTTTVANNLTVSVTTITANAWVISAFTNNWGNGVAGANTTARISGVLSFGDSGVVATPSSQGQTWSLTGSSNWTGFSVSLSPATTGIQVDSTSGGTSASTSITVSHTIGSNSNRLLLVGQWCQGPGDTSTGVTYGGTSMTQLVKVMCTGAANNQWLYIYGMLNPPTGTANIVASSTSVYTYIAACSYSGVNALPSITSTAVTSGATSLLGTLTTVATDSWLVGFTYSNSAPPTAGTSTVLRQQTGTYAGQWIIDSGTGQGSSGSKSLTITQSPSAFMAMVLCAIEPLSSGTSPNYPSFLLNFI